MDRSRRRHLQAAALLMGAAALPRAQAQSRPLMQASPWRQVPDLAAWWVSEKLDGMRGFWDGHALWTRSGKPIHAPAWFTEDWPTTPMDGELWSGRGQFERTVSIVRQQQTKGGGWRELRFMVFDLPAHPGPFDARLAMLTSLLDQPAQPWLQTMKQVRVPSQSQLRQRLAQVVSEGGEGLMLHHGQALYRGERSRELLKLKPLDDAEATVIAHLPGTGRLAHKLGALLVEMEPEGRHPPRRFKLGSGLNDQDRERPPPIGARISFRYRGLTGAGLPRFASYWRLRPEE